MLFLPLISLRKGKRLTKGEQVKIRMMFFSKLQVNISIKKEEAQELILKGEYLFTSERCKKGVMERIFVTGILHILVNKSNNKLELEE